MSPVEYETELGRLREHLRRVQQVCELHRKMGEDTEFEIRELRRKVETAHSNLTQVLQHYAHLAGVVEKSGTEDMKGYLELCDAALKSLSKTILAF